MKFEKWPHVVMRNPKSGEERPPVLSSSTVRAYLELAFGVWCDGWQFASGVWSLCPLAFLAHSGRHRRLVLLLLTLPLTLLAATAPLTTSRLLQFHQSVQAQSLITYIYYTRLFFLNTFRASQLNWS